GGAAGIAAEVEVSTGLRPGPGELAATMLIEITEASQIKPVLDKLLGIDTRDYVTLTVGPHVADDDVRPDRQRHIVARVDAEELVEDRLDLRRLGDLDEHRRCELTRPRPQPGGNLDLGRDPRRAP